MQATLTAIGSRDRTTTAIAWEPRGYTAGPASLMGSILRAAGLTNAANGQRLGTEAMLRHPPDLLVVPDTPAFPSLATDMLDTPALRAIPRRPLPPALTICAGPFTAQAVALLAR
jgi:iron complex transport system substrate-binding protein